MNTRRPAGGLRYPDPPREAGVRDGPGAGRSLTRSMLSTVMRATLAYTLLRILIFAAVAGILALLGVHGITLLAVALVISAIISLPLLSRLRDRMSASLAGRTERLRAGLEAGSRREDAGPAEPAGTPPPR